MIWSPFRASSDDWTAFGIGDIETGSLQKTRPEQGSRACGTWTKCGRWSTHLQQRFVVPKSYNVGRIHEMEWTTRSECPEYNDYVALLLPSEQTFVGAQSLRGRVSSYSRCDRRWPRGAYRSKTRVSTATHPLSIHTPKTTLCNHWDITPLIWQWKFIVHCVFFLIHVPWNCCLQAVEGVQENPQVQPRHSILLYETMEIQ